MARILISQNATKSVYRNGDIAVKVFCKGFPKEEVLNEALISARIEAIGGINIPSTLAVAVDADGCWSITKDFIEGKTLEQLMMENPERQDDYLADMVDLQLTIHSKVCPLLHQLKGKLSRQISETKEINPASHYDLITRLNGMPRQSKLCHGDFQPNNIVVKPDGTMFVLDWVHATQGDGSTDAARTWMLLALDSQETADRYLTLFCEKSGTDKRYVEQWLPIVAAAQLTKHRPEEEALLRRCLDVCEY